jgi:acyl phosphate:glycerol-3-phosphate acyltransferase
MNMIVILILLLTYFIGSIPTAWIVGKLFGGALYDIRDHGSGNVGTTNVIRNLGWLPGLITFLVDSLKGFAVVFWMPVLIAPPMEYETARVLLSAIALIGHTFPVYINFRGGKAVATTVGIIFAFRWEIGLICMAVFLVALLISRQSGVASMSAAFAFPVTNLVFLFLLQEPIPQPMLWFSIVLPFYILYTHRENIRKICRGNNKKDF